MSPELSSRRVHDPTARKVAGKTSVSQPDGPQLTSLRLHVICVVLTLLAAYIFTLTEHDDHQHTFWCIFEIALQTVLVVVATAYFRMRLSLLHESNVIMPMLVMIACLSLICEPIQRLLFGTGHAFEMLIMHSQCNLMLALGVCGFRVNFQRLAVIIAVFMTIFCCTISTAQGLVPLTILFAVTAIVWLVASWWETVDRRLLLTEQSTMPRIWLATAAALPVIALLWAGTFGQNAVTNALRGFMPSSGGTGDYSPFSRAGVNDGDALVAGNDNIKSFAPIENAPFLDSDQPSLYDVFNDLFDEPPRKIKKQERAIALPADLFEDVHRMMAEAKQAGREFSLIRNEQTADDKRIRDLETNALFYVAGRTPLHLKLEAYELFDGVTWTPIEHEPILGLSLKQTDDRHWLNIPQPGKGFGMYSGTETHSIKNANLDGNRVPVPSHLVGVNIDEVDRADMYQAYDSGLVELRRNSIPSMTPINVVSWCVDESVLTDSERISVIHRSKVRTTGDLCIALPDHQDVERIRDLARQCAEGLPRGWEQIEAVVEFLRANYVVDRETRASSESDSPIGDFLFESKRGPEYLFASSAAVMLRTLGYSTRMVSGFYARPDKYDDRSRHTPVHAADAHFWCEVAIGANTWLTLEASPGYETLSPPPGIFQQLWNLLQQAWQFAVQNAVAVILILVVIAFVIARRTAIQNLLLTLRWKLTPHKSASRRAVKLAVLIEHRLRLAGLERNPGTTLRRWSKQPALEPVRANINRVADIADAVVFGGDTDGNVDGDELNSLATQLSFKELQRLRKQSDLSEQKNKTLQAI